MEQEKLARLLNELGRRTAEPVRPGLAEEIKEHIPDRLTTHRKGIDTINIMIDLRVSKLTAAAVIIITMILLANLHGLYRDGGTVARYLLGVPSKSDILVGRTRYEHLVGQGKEAVFYGDIIDRKDSNAVLMQWRLADGRYMVVFADFREQELDAEELVKLQARMLLKKQK